MNTNNTSTTEFVLTPIKATKTLKENTLSFQQELFEEWLLQSGARPITVENYSRAISNYVGYLNDCNCPTAAAAWLKWNVSAPVRRLTGYAGKKYIAFMAEVFPDEPICLGVSQKLPPASRPKPQPINSQQFKQLLQAAKNTLPHPTSYSVRIWLQLLEETGIRRGESIIRWKQVSAENELTVYGKGGGSRKIPLSRKMHRRLLWLQKRNPDYPWIGARRRNHLSAKVLYILFKKLAHKIGLPELRPHFLRATCLTRLAATPGGFDPLNLMAISGHNDISSLRYYCQAQMPRLRELMEKSRSKT